MSAHTPDDATRTEMVDRAHRLANEIAQIFYDADHWNRTHPTEQAIDPDPDGSLRRAFDSLGVLLRGERRLVKPLPGGGSGTPERETP